MDGEKRLLAAKEYDALFGELEFLRERNVLEPETVAAARELYERSEPKNVFQKTVVLVSVLLGVAALGFGIWVLVDEYWQDLSDFLQLYSVLVPFAASCVGYLAARIMKKELASQIALFSVCGFFFLSCLVLRTFDQRPQPVTVVWLAGALAAALAAFFSDGVALHLFAAILCAVRIITGCIDNFYPLWAGGPYALDALLIVAMGFYWSYRRVNMRVGGFYFLLLGLWAFATALDASPFSAMTNIAVVAAGSALALVSAWGRELKVLDKTSFWPPYFLVAGALFFASFRTPLRISSWPKEGSNPYLLYMIWLAAVAALAFCLARRKRALNGEARDVALRVLSFLFSPEGVALLTVPMAIAIGAAGEKSRDETLPYLLSFYGTALVFGVASRLVVVGANGRPSILTAGVAYFIIWFISRLFEFTDAGRGLLGVWIFLAIAIGCFVLAYFTVRMKKLAAVREPDPEPVLTREPQPVVPKIVGNVAAWLTVAAMIAAVIAVLCCL